VVTPGGSNPQPFVNVRRRGKRAEHFANPCARRLEITAESGGHPEPRIAGRGHPWLARARGNRHSARCHRLLMRAAEAVDARQGITNRHTRCVRSSLGECTSLRHHARRRVSGQRYPCPSGHPIGGDEQRTLLRAERFPEFTCKPFQR